MSSTWSSAVREAREVEYRFLCKARKVCRQAAENLIFEPDGPNPSQVARDLYAEGINQKILSGNYDEFVGYCRDLYYFSVWGGQNAYYSVRRYRGYDTSNRYGTYYRQGPGYVRLPHHQKKEANGNAAWREHKQFNRDKSKSRGYRGYNARSYGKRQVHHANRQHTRRMLEAERFDEITQNVQDVIRCWWD